MKNPFRLDKLILAGEGIIYTIIAIFVFAIVLLRKHQIK
jgi:hypothetical protein